MEVPIFMAFLINIRQNQLEHAAREKSIAELRKMVHETMTGLGENKQSRHKRPRGWEHGEERMGTIGPVMSK
jgi:hypothetical protein